MAAALAVLALNVPVARAQENIATLVARTGPAVVLLKSYGANGSLLGEGSGFHLEDRRIVTNWHVVRGAARVEVIGADGVLRGQMDAADAVDTEGDLAILPAVPSGTTGLPLAPGETPVGTRILVIGAPQGLSNTVSDGLVSAVRVMEGRELIQISAPISPGSSGGPVLDLEGRVIGIAVATLRTGQNLNFAVPVRALMELSAKPAQRLAFTNVPERFSGDAANAGSFQNWIAPGQRISGRLELTDRQLSDLSFYDEFHFDATAGQTVTISMTSSDFDTYLQLGRVADDRFVQLARDDDGGDGNNARIIYRTPTDGDYVIRANSYQGGALGAYVLTFQRR